MNSSGKNNTNNKEEKTWIDLGNGSELVYFPRLFCHSQSLEWLNYLDQHIPWTRPSLFIFGRTCSQPRETCYVSKSGLPAYKYSGYEPVIHSWDDYPPLKDILQAVHEAVPGSTFNSLLLNRYKHGGDYVGWHSDNEVLYGPTPTIASVTFGAEREFMLRKKKTKISKGEGVQALNNGVETKEDKKIKRSESEVQGTITQMSAVSTTLLSTKRAFQSNTVNIFEKLKTNRGDSHSQVSQVYKDRYSFMLKHGSLFVMKGYTQRDWEHSVPKRLKLPGLRINLTFRYVRES